MNRFVLLGAAVVAAAFGVGLGLGLAFGATGGTTKSAPDPSASTSAPGSPSALPAIAKDCRANSVHTAISLICSSALPGVDQVLVVQWPSAASMAADFQESYGGRPDGKCSEYDGQPASGITSTWGNGKPLACYRNAQGAAIILWEDPGKRTEVLGIRSDGDTRKAFAWWTQAVKLPL